MSDQYTERGKRKTSLYCHQCGKHFVAVVDYGLDGQHVIICPRCGHRHARQIKDGVVTSERWASNPDTPSWETTNVWTDDSLEKRTTSVSHFLFDSWLNRGGDGHL
jgi:DNA-directed RNA polymerase subunit RPC12/RpoP